MSRYCREQSCSSGVRVGNGSVGVIAFFHVVCVSQAKCMWCTGLSESWFFFPSVLEIAMKFGHPSVTLWILSLFGHCLEPQSQLCLSNILGFVWIIKLDCVWKRNSAVSHSQEVSRNSARSLSANTTCGLFSPLHCGRRFPHLCWNNWMCDHTEVDKGADPV